MVPRYGLRNSGVQCFVNSSLQMLFSVPSVVRVICAGDDQAQNGSGTVQVGVKQALYNLYQSCLKNKVSAITEFIRVVKAMKVHEHITYNVQEDSHSFFAALFDRYCDDFQALPDLFRRDYMERFYNDPKGTVLHNEHAALGHEVFARFKENPENTS